MSSTRIEHLLDEIARLSPKEREELMRALPHVSGKERAADTLTVASVEHAVAVRESIRRRLCLQHQPLGSVDDDLDSVRSV
jgi:hypothetical protein